MTVVTATSLEGRITPPPSKSYTHRAILISSLAEGESSITDPLTSRDTNATRRACTGFGASIEQEGRTLKVSGRRPRTPDDVIDVENSGTTLRFMSSALSLAPSGFSILTGDDSIRRRPMQPLIDALNELGVDSKSSRNNGCAPIIVKGGGLHGGEVIMRGDVSSQFVSSLLISAPLAEKDVSIHVKDAVSKPYVDATIAVMTRFGAKVTRNDHAFFSVESGMGYQRAAFRIPGDFSSASFIAGAVALIGGRVELSGLDFRLPQGDASIIRILKSMGASIKTREDGFIIESDGNKLEGGRFDLSDTPDLLPVLAVLALKCDSEVEIVGVEHARYKETDRIGTVSKELKKLGARIVERQDGLTIKPGELKPAPLEAHDDHRMFMAFSLVSMLFEQGTPVRGEESIDVSYPSFLKDLQYLGATVRRV